MTIKVFAVYDQKAEAYLTPFFVNSKGLAIRSFTDAVNDPKVLGKYPGDFTLFEIGEYDPIRGQMQPHVTNIACGNGLEFVEEEDRNQLPLPFAGVSQNQEKGLN